MNNQNNDDMRNRQSQDSGSQYGSTGDDDQPTISQKGGRAQQGRSLENDLEDADDSDLE